MSSNNNPKITFGDDNKHVIYRNGANGDNMIIQVNNDELINATNLQNEDNFVLGTTEPILVINDLQSNSTNAHSILRLSNNVPEFWDISAGITGTTDDFALHIGKDNSQYVNISITGDVGIGVLEPTKNLDIIGDTLIRGGDLCLTDQNTRINGDGTDMRFYTSNAERMVMLQNGRVGIGITNPDSTLHVSDLHAQSLAIDETVYFGEMGVTGDLTVFGGTIQLLQENDAYGIKMEGNDLTFRTAGVERIRIDMNGQINLLENISTATFSEDIGVSGTAYINNLNVPESELTNVTITNDLGVSGTTYLNTLDVNNDAVFQEDIGVSGTSYLAHLNVMDNMVVAGNTFLSGNLFADANVDIDAELDVQNLATFQNNISVLGDANINNANVNTIGVTSLLTTYGQIDAKSLATFNDNIDVKGNAIINTMDAISISAPNATFTDLGVSGVAYINDIVMSGNLGIGVTQPLKELDIQGDLLVRGGDICFVDDSTSIGISGDRLVFNTNSEPRMYIEPDGSVVIGLTYPNNTDERFYVDGNTRIDGDLNVTGNVSLQSIDGTIEIGTSNFGQGIQLGNGNVTVHVPGDINVGGVITFTDGNAIGFVNENTADASDFGIFGKYVDSGVTTTYSGVGRDATYGTWGVFNQTTFPDNPEFRTDDWNLADFSANKIGIGTQTADVSLHISGTDAILFPKGDDSARPSGVQGYVRYNTNANKIEFYDGTSCPGVGLSELSPTGILIA